MNNANKEYWYQDFTLKGRIFYPQLVDGKLNDRGQLRYSTMFVWPWDEQKDIVAKIGAFLIKGKALVAPNWPMENFVVPLKKWGVYVKQDGTKPTDIFLENCYWVNASSGEKFKPVVVDQNKQPVIDPAEIYSGRNALMNFSFYHFNANGKQGISVNCKSVMLLDGGDHEGGGASVDLKAAFGSFSSDMGTAPTPDAAAASAFSQEPAQGAASFI